jgi:hypothetical protein
MRFDDKSPTEAVGEVIGRMTGNYLRVIAVEAQRIIAASPEASVDEITNEVVAMLRQRGADHADPAEVRKAVIEVRKSAR